MREVVIVGGGLSGMAAAVELEKHNINYTMIEVKNRLGGGLNTVAQDGFTIDTGAFFLANEPDLQTILADFELEDALYAIDDETVAFKAGVNQLIETMRAKITAPIMRRMAVSSIGKIGNRYSICMENGLMLDAKSLILAVPARYAERMFYGYIPEIAHQLLDFCYDSIMRVAIGCHQDDLPQPIQLPPDMLYPFVHQTHDISRAPENHTLLQVGVRIEPEKCQSLDEVVPEVLKMIRLEKQPITQRIDYWREADLLSCHDDDHVARLRNIQQQLPDGIALTGSDYSLVPASYRGVFRLSERIRQGQNAANKMFAFIS